MHNDFLDLIDSGSDASFLGECEVFYDYIEDEDVLEELDYWDKAYSELCYLKMTLCHICN